MKKWLTKDTCSAAFLLLFSLWWQWGAAQIKIQDFDNGMPANYMPQLLGWVLFVLSAISLIQSVRKISKGENPKKDSVSKNHKIMLGLLAALLVYSLAMGTLGFVVCTILFLFGTTSYLNAPKQGKRDAAFFVRHVVISCLVTAAFYLIFVVGFEISLPTLFL